MLVKVNTSLAGADFSYNFGALVEADDFSSRVGNGWESLCDPVETADEPVAFAVVVEPAIEVATKPAPVEFAVKRGRRR
ncbi:hypothetical protein OIU34_28040 [Pararhizobium sp. BT-229]|uniref:hypothetical protein n=1 Tax=Pararhizobium sp. BT-229 TaxID=2986923 RepID=UPI0021F79B10|nr:hypothetical protein [Pararhizobium sp. BT-229]MCV9965726.1 hypothetical protein [Pararhizobium sp. BT-229]